MLSFTHSTASLDVLTTFKGAFILPQNSHLQTPESSKTQIDAISISDPGLEKMLLPQDDSLPKSLIDGTVKTLNNWELPIPPTYPIQTKQSLESILNVNTAIDTPSQNRPYVVGHRGSLYEYPENTIRSFIASNESGCDAVELDVFLLKCGTLVVFHGSGSDQNPGLLKEYCNVDGSILDYTAKEARELLRLNPLHEEFGCPDETILDFEHAFIPNLEEVLIEMKKTNMTVKIELKGPDTTIPVLNLVKKLDMVNQCHFSSFAHERIALVRKLHPELNSDGSHVYKTGALYANEVPENFVENARNIGASEIHLKYDTCTKERVDEIHNAGMESMCWFRGPIGMREDVDNKYNDVGNEDSRMYEVVRRTGVGAMCVNKPKVLLALLDQPQSVESLFSELPKAFDIADSIAKKIIA